MRGRERDEKKERRAKRARESESEREWGDGSVACRGARRSCTTYMVR